MLSDKLNKLAGEIVEDQNSAKVHPIRMDCADSKSVQKAFDAVKSLGPVEVLV